MALSETLGNRPAVDAVFNGRKLRIAFDFFPFLYHKAGTVPADRLIIFPQKPCRCSDAADIGGGGLHCVDKAAPGIHAGVALHTKMPLVSLLLLSFRGIKSAFP